MLTVMANKKRFKTTKDSAIHFYGNLRKQIENKAGWWCYAYGVRLAYKQVVGSGPLSYNFW